MTTWKNRAEKAEDRAKEFELKLTMASQQGAEAIMRNVALKIKNRDIAAAVSVWKYAQQDEKYQAQCQARAEDIMRKVGGRWKNQELWAMFREWRGKQLEEYAQIRAEGIMKRVGSRMRNKDLALNYQEWKSNAFNDRVTTWKNRAEKAELALGALEMTVMMKANVGAEKIMKRVARDWLSGSSRVFVFNWKENLTNHKQRLREKRELALKLLPWATCVGIPTTK